MGTCGSLKTDLELHDKIPFCYKHEVLGKCDFGHDRPYLRRHIERQKVQHTTEMKTFKETGRMPASN